LLNCPKIDVKGHYGMCAQSEVLLSSQYHKEH
jgi:hypothetical protein